MLPVPNARRVTFTLDLPRVTQSVADPRARNSGTPVPASRLAPSPALRKLRREQLDMILRPPMGLILSREAGGGCYAKNARQVVITRVWVTMAARMLPAWLRARPQNQPKTLAMTSHFQLGKWRNQRCTPPN